MDYRSILTFPDGEVNDVAVFGLVTEIFYNGFQAVNDPEEILLKLNPLLEFIFSENELLVRDDLLHSITANLSKPLVEGHFPLWRDHVFARTYEELKEGRKNPTGLLRIMTSFLLSGQKKGVDISGISCRTSQLCTNTTFYYESICQSVSGENLNRADSNRATIKLRDSRNGLSSFQNSQEEIGEKSPHFRKNVPMNSVTSGSINPAFSRSLQTLLQSAIGNGKIFGVLMEFSNENIRSFLGASKWADLMTLLRPPINFETLALLMVTTILILWDDENFHEIFYTSGSGTAFVTICSGAINQMTEEEALAGVVLTLEFATGFEACPMLTDRMKREIEQNKEGFLKSIRPAYKSVLINIFGPIELGLIFWAHNKSHPTAKAVWLKMLYDIIISHPANAYHLKESTVLFKCLGRILLFEGMDSHVGNYAFLIYEHVLSRNVSKSNLRLILQSFEPFAALRLYVLPLKSELLLRAINDIRSFQRFQFVLMKLLLRIYSQSKELPRNPTGIALHFKGKNKSGLIASGAVTLGSEWAIRVVFQPIDSRTTQQIRMKQQAGSKNTNFKQGQWNSGKIEIIQNYFESSQSNFPFKMEDAWSKSIFYPNAEEKEKTKEPCSREKALLMLQSEATGSKLIIQMSLESSCFIVSLFKNGKKEKEDSFPCKISLNNSNSLLLSLRRSSNRLKLSLNGAELNGTKNVIFNEVSSNFYSLQMLALGAAGSVSQSSNGTKKLSFSSGGVFRGLIFDFEVKRFIMNSSGISIKEEVLSLNSQWTRKKNFCHSEVVSDTAKDCPLIGLPHGSRWIANGVFVLSAHGFADLLSQIQFPEIVVNLIGFLRFPNVMVQKQSFFMTSGTNSNRSRSTSGWNSSSSDASRSDLNMDPVAGSPSNRNQSHLSLDMGELEKAFTMNVSHAPLEVLLQLLNEVILNEDATSPQNQFQIDYRFLCPFAYALEVYVESCGVSLEVLKQLEKMICRKTTPVRLRVALFQAFFDSLDRWISDKQHESMAWAVGCILNIILYFKNDKEFLELLIDRTVHALFMYLHIYCDRNYESFSVQMNLKGSFSEHMSQIMDKIQMGDSQLRDKLIQTILTLGEQLSTSRIWEKALDHFLVTKDPKNCKELFSLVKKMVRNGSFLHAKNKRPKSSNVGNEEVLITRHREAGSTPDVSTDLNIAKNNQAEPMNDEEKFYLITCLLAKLPEVKDKELTSQILAFTIEISDNSEYFSNREIIECISPRNLKHFGEKEASFFIKEAQDGNGPEVRDKCLEFLRKGFKFSSKKAKNDTLFFASQTPVSTLNSSRVFHELLLLAKVSKDSKLLSKLLDHFFKSFKDYQDNGTSLHSLSELFLRMSFFFIQTPEKLLKTNREFLSLVFSEFSKGLRTFESPEILLLLLANVLEDFLALYPSNALFADGLSESLMDLFEVLVEKVKSLRLLYVFWPFIPKDLENSIFSFRSSYSIKNGGFLRAMLRISCKLLQFRAIDKREAPKRVLVEVISSIKEKKVDFLAFERSNSFISKISSISPKCIGDLQELALFEENSKRATRSTSLKKVEDNNAQFSSDLHSSLFVFLFRKLTKALMKAELRKKQQETMEGKSRERTIAEVLLSLIRTEQPLINQLKSETEEERYIEKPRRLEQCKKGFPLLLDQNQMKSVQKASSVQEATYLAIKAIETEKELFSSSRESDSEKRELLSNEFLNEVSLVSKTPSFSLALNMLLRSIKSHSELLLQDTLLKIKRSSKLQPFSMIKMTSHAHLTALILLKKDVMDGSASSSSLKEAIQAQSPKKQIRKSKTELLIIGEGIFVKEKLVKETPKATPKKTSKPPVSPISFSGKTLDKFSQRPPSKLKEQKAPEEILKSTSSQKLEWMSRRKEIIRETINSALKRYFEEKVAHRQKGFSLLKTIEKAESQFGYWKQESDQDLLMAHYPVLLNAFSSHLTANSLTVLPVLSHDKEAPGSQKKKTSQTDKQETIKILRSRVDKLGRKFFFKEVHPAALASYWNPENLKSKPAFQKIYMLASENSSSNHFLEIMDSSSVSNNSGNRFPSQVKSNQGPDFNTSLPGSPTKASQQMRNGNSKEDASFNIFSIVEEAKETNAQLNDLEMKENQPVIILGHKSKRGNYHLTSELMKLSNAEEEKFKSAARISENIDFARLNSKTKVPSPGSEKYFRENLRKPQDNNKEKLENFLFSVESSIQRSLKHGHLAEIESENFDEAKAAMQENVFKGKILKSEIITLKGGIFGETCLTGRALFFRSNGEARPDDPEFTFGTLKDEQRLIQIRKRVSFDEVEWVLGKRYCLMNQAYEVRKKNKKSLFINFFNPKKAEEFARFLISKNVRVIAHQNRTAEFKKSKFTEKWMKRHMSTFEYLMLVNEFAGRSVHDLNQYPVFPWIKLFGKKNSKRALSTPLGAIKKKQREEAIKRHMMQQETVLNPSFPDPHHYGTLYSTSGKVLLYLLRIEPFTTLHIDFQGGSVDNRVTNTFSEIAQIVRTSLSDHQSHVELPPEYFYLPETFVTQNKEFMREIMKGGEIPDMAFPDDFKGNSLANHLFIAKHREELESEAVSEEIHAWIDLMFGVDQYGKRAKEKLNSYPCYSYEQFLQREFSLEGNYYSDQALQEAVNMGLCFGIVPFQLFKEPHLKRGPEPKNPQSLFFSSLFSEYRAKTDKRANWVLNDLDFGSLKIIRIFLKNGNFYLISSENIIYSFKYLSSFPL